MKEISLRKTGEVNSTLCQANSKRNQQKDLRSNLKTVLITSCISITFGNGIYISMTLFASVIINICIKLQIYSPRPIELI